MNVETSYERVLCAFSLLFSILAMYACTILSANNAKRKFTVCDQLFRKPYRTRSTRTNSHTCTTNVRAHRRQRRTVKPTSQEGEQLQTHACCCVCSCSHLFFSLLFLRSVNTKTSLFSSSDKTIASHRSLRF